MKPVVIDISKEGEPLLFAHANGYPPQSYQQLFDHLSPRFAIRALEHRPLWGGREPPRKLRWQLFADDLLAAMRDNYDAPVRVMGHSMGATIAALAAAREPQRFAALILLDPVFLPDRYVIGTRLMPERRRRKIPMIRRALSRPETFEDSDDAFTFYRGKRAFRGLSDAALQDYVEASTARRADGLWELRFSGSWEAAIYGSAPRVRSSLKKLRLPTLGMRGRDSDTLSPEIWSRWAHWQPHAQLREMPGGHLFPLEYPAETAETILSGVFPD